MTAAYTNHARYTRPQRDVDDVCIKVSNSAVKLHPEFHRVTDIIQLKFFGGNDREHEKKKEKKAEKEGETEMSHYNYKVTVSCL